MTPSSSRKACTASRSAQRVRLPAAPAIEREHELGAKSFAVRVVGDEQLELRNGLGRIAYCQCASMRSSALAAQLFEPRRLGLRERLVDEVGERGPRRAWAHRRDPKTPGIGGCARRGERVFETGSRRCRTRRAGRIPARAVQGTSVARPQPRDVDLDVIACRCRPIARPQLLDQPLTWDDLVRVQQQYRKQARCFRFERNRTAIPGRLEGAKDPELERRHVETHGLDGVQRNSAPRATLHDSTTKGAQMRRLLLPLAFAASLAVAAPAAAVELDSRDGSAHLEDHQRLPERRSDRRGLRGHAENEHLLRQRRAAGSPVVVVTIQGTTTNLSTGESVDLALTRLSSRSRQRQGAGQQQRRHPTARRRRRDPLGRSTRLDAAVASIEHGPDTDRELAERCAALSGSA